MIKVASYGLRVGLIAIAWFLALGFQSTPGLALPGWGYQGGEDPAHWGDLAPEFMSCRLGQDQSPIDIRQVQSGEKSQLEFNYPPMRLEFEDIGNTLRVNATAGQMHIDGEVIPLRQFHFHLPGEHQIEGHAAAMELHFVHQQDERTVVVAVMIEAGPENSALQTLWQGMGSNSTLKLFGDLRRLLPTHQRYFHYRGSLTTPPCSEGVEWYVMAEPIFASSAQIRQFRQQYSFNARPIQPTHQREIRVSS